MDQREDEFAVSFHTITVCRHRRRRRRRRRCQTTSQRRLPIDPINSRSEKICIFASSFVFLLRYSVLTLSLKSTKIVERFERSQLWLTPPARFSDTKSLLKTTQDYFFSFIWSISCVRCFNYNDSCCTSERCT